MNCRKVDFAPPIPQRKWGRGGGRQYAYIYLLLITFLFFACSTGSEIDIRSLEKNKGPDEIINTFEMILHSGEKTEWLMTADLVERFNSERYWWAYSVFLETLNNEDKNFYRSDSIHVSDISNIFTGMGNVEIISPNGYLSTDKIIWNRMTERIHAPNNVYIKKDSNEIWGNDLNTNMNLDFIDLRHVRGSGNAIDN